MSEALRAGDLVLRPATLDDATFAADLWTAVRPDDPQDPAMYAYYWANPPAERVIERYIGLLDGTAVANAAQMHDRWPSDAAERFVRIGADTLPAHRTAERLDALVHAMETLARADGALTLTSWAWEDDPLKCETLQARGYREDRRERFWELDLAAHRANLERMAEESRARMREQGIDVGTIDRIDDPDKWHKLWQMSEEAGRDVPRTGPYVETSFEDFMTWTSGPGIHLDRMWVARQGDQILGISILSYPERGVVSTDWTGMARAARGKGIARALKCETVMQAIALGVDRIRTDNDSTNTPILHINETMGYVRRADMILFMREA